MYKRVNYDFNGVNGEKGNTYPLSFNEGQLLFSSIKLFELRSPTDLFWTCTLSESKND
jgi:hypothetical protein